MAFIKRINLNMSEAGRLTIGVIIWPQSSKLSLRMAVGMTSRHIVYQKMRSEITKFGQHC